MTEENKSENLLAGESASDFAANHTQFQFPKTPDETEEVENPENETDAPSLSEREVPEDIRNAFAQIAKEQTMGRNFDLDTKESKVEESAPDNLEKKFIENDPNPSAHSLKIEKVSFSERTLAPSRKIEPETTVEPSFKAQRDNDRVSLYKNLLGKRETEPEEETPAASQEIKPEPVVEETEKADEELNNRPAAKNVRYVNTNPLTEKAQNDEKPAAEKIEFPESKAKPKVQIPPFLKDKESDSYGSGGAWKQEAITKAKPARTNPEFQANLPRDEETKLTRSERIKAENERLQEEAELNGRGRFHFNKNRSKSDDFDDDDSDEPITKRKNSITRLLIISIVAVVVVLGLGSYLFVSSSLKAVKAADKSFQTVNIPDNSSNAAVSQILSKNKLIKNPTIFEIYSKLTGNSKFRSGYYSLSKSMTAEQIAKELEKGGTATPPVIGKITIPEGFTIDQMATAMTQKAGTKEKTPFTSAEFLKVVKDPDFISEMKSKYPTLFASLPDANSGVKYQLEGYLFPATYSYTSQTTVKQIVEQMIAKENTVLTPYYAEIQKKNLSVNSLLCLAALVEKEANTQSDRQNVAEVFLNRLNDDMPLQSNVALLYAEGKLGTSSASDDKNVDTSLNSPFNLYTNKGMGPGPVDSPSQMSIDSVINHAQNSYYYFVADSKTGKVYFAYTLAEQNANIAKYVN